MPPLQPARVSAAARQPAVNALLLLAWLIGVYLRLPFWAFAAASCSASSDSSR